MHSRVRLKIPPEAGVKSLDQCNIQGNLLMKRILLAIIVGLTFANLCWGRDATATKGVAETFRFPLWNAKAHLSQLASRYIYEFHCGRLKPSATFLDSKDIRLSHAEGAKHLDDLVTRPLLFNSYYQAQKPTGSERQKDFFEMPGEFEEKKEGLKSVTKAALFSFLLPGTGEIYAGSQTKGKIFIAVDASFWAGFFGFRTYGGWLKRDYKVYAASHAGANLAGKPDDFFDNLAFYDSRDKYNQFALLYHRGDVTPYPENDFWNWEWDSPNSKSYYRDIKNRSKTAYRTAIYMVGLSLVNRVVSVIDAMKTVKSYNRKKSMEISKIKFDLELKPFGHDPKFVLYLTRRW
jgi:TM2 domain-containing membrane protein YozV